MQLIGGLEHPNIVRAYNAGEANGVHFLVMEFVDGLTLFGLGYSWGGFESLLLPVHPEHTRTATPWTAAGPWLRIHAGLEAPADLIEDLAAAFERWHRAGEATGG